VSGTLVAGVGNVFLGDDGFGVEVARRLADEPLPPDIQVRDFGIRAVHLAYELLEPRDLVIIVDAAGRGGAPGTLYLIEASERDQAANRAAGDAHAMDVRAVLASAMAMGAPLPRVLIAGCEPADLSERMGLSAVVEQAVPEALRMIRTVLERSKEVQP
jgi:hydrogenase maturation protease